LERYIARAANVGAHRRPKLPDPKGVKKPFATWCAEGDSDAIMAALAASEYVVSGDPGASKLIGDVFEGQMADILDPSEIEIFRTWIAQGCPARIQASTKVLFESRAEDFAADLAGSPVGDSFGGRRALIGAGAVH